MTLDCAPARNAASMYIMSMVPPASIPEISSVSYNGCFWEKSVNSRRLDA